MARGARGQVHVRRKLAAIPTEVDIASEFRYRGPLVNKQTFYRHHPVGRDGGHAGGHARGQGPRRHGHNDLQRGGLHGEPEADGVVYTHAGPEIGVASTKAFTAQLTALYLFGLFFGSLRGALSAEDMKRSLPTLCTSRPSWSAAWSRTRP